MALSVSEGQPAEQPSRVEFVEWKFQLDRDQYAKHRDDIGILDPPTGKTMELEPNDTLNVTYWLRLEYFGQVVEKLQAVKRLMDSGDVKCVGEREWFHARSVFLETVRAIDACCARNK